MKARQWVLAGLGVAALLAFAWTACTRSLWSPDEGRYAEIGREMLISGDWVTPRLDYVRYFEKPPLVYWATAASLAVFGHSEAAARLPVIAASLSVLALTRWLGAMVAGNRVGWLAALLLACCPMFFAMAQTLVLDMPLTAFVTAALCVTWRGLEEATADAPGWTRWPIGASALLGFATLTKGPIAVLLGGMVILPTLAMPEYRALIPRLPWLRMTVAYALVTVPWFVLIGRAHPEFLTFFFWHEHFDRFLKTSHARPGPPYYFLVVLLAGFFPWSCLGPAALAATTRLKTAARRYLACWIILPVVFFSVSKSKLPPYILPVFPPLAVLCAAALEPLTRESDARVRRRLAFGGGLVSVVALAVMARAATLEPKHWADLMTIRAPAMAPLSLCAVAGLASTRAFAQGHVREGLELLLGITLIGLTGAALLTPYYEPMKDSRVLARQIAARRAPGDPVYIYGPLEGHSALPFYLESPVTITGFFYGELAMAHDAPQGDEASRFLDAAAVVERMAPDRPRAWFVTETVVFDDYFARQPGMRLAVVHRHGKSLVFTNKP